MRQWVFALPVGRDVWFWDDERGEYYVKNIELAYAQELVNNTNEALSVWASDTPPSMSPYKIPVLKEHARMGWRGGDIYGARLAGEGLAYGIYLDVEWLPEVEQAIASGSTAHVSIGTAANYVDYTGRAWGALIDELSITENPRLKNLGTIQDTMALRLSDAVKNGVKKKMEDAEIMGHFDKVNARVEGTEKKLDEVLELLKKLNPDDADVVDEVIDEESVDGEQAGEGDEGDPDEDAVMKLADRLVKKASIKAAEKLGLERLNDHVPTDRAPKGKKTREQEADELGLKGKAKSLFVLTGKKPAAAKTK